MDISAILLAASITSSSYTYWCNVGNGINGIMPLIQGRLGHLDIPVLQKVEAWEKASAGGHRAYVPSALISIGLNLAGAYVTPHQLSRTILLIASALGVAFVPYSISIHPTMDKLKALMNGNLLVDKADGSEEGKEAFRLMTKWETLQAVRTTLFGVIWGLTLWAVFLL
ncbi:uncharacterized protein I303_106944 [Kwoniella dejecticola CBS 10117]|uniref:DUF1772 domain-containing protein n=1 Tax=Kwoniella dejecticola CBS 10117 TaxID=1296121 RepID=A0A1A5ZYA4_9TREE|nr:uncharacterized protein I303_06346 [Kwoniella dejecticola CBS 10117]OBR82789.1 hypothetical protein I303_06346 [Kwoniella dejecticola CBS 10117]